MNTRVARVVVREDGLIEARSVVVGNLRGLPAPGSVVGPGSVIGTVSTLGVMTSLVLPKDAATGRVQARVVGKSASVGVGHDQPLFTYTTEDATEIVAGAKQASGALVFRAPMAGRFYRKASPDKPSLVELGEVIEHGRALGLVEVMKTFHRLSYAGEGLPARAKLVRALVEDGADIAQGDALFEVEAVSA